MRKMLTLAALTMAAAVIPNRADAKAAKCEITSSVGKYVGPCNFEALEGGFDFDIPKSLRGKLGTHLFHMEITSPGKGELYTDWVGGGREFEDNVVRQEANPACWAGEIWRVCIY